MRAIVAALCSFVFCFSVAFAEQSEGEKPLPKLEPIYVGQLQRIEVLPAAIKISTPLQKVQCVVSGFYSDGRVQDLTRATEFRPLVGGIVMVSDAFVKPVSNGKTEMMVSVGGVAQKISVEVSGQETPEKISFQYGTLAALSKNGCNSGGCHGAPSGKGGFAISMVAFDPEADKISLTRDFMNRRINMPEPESSLLLRKPRMQVAHRGGLKLRKEDEAYQVLVDWISQGCKFDEADAARLVGIRVDPSLSRTYEWPAHSQQLRVTARFTDGSERDITRLAMYSSSEEGLATVSEGGLVVARGRGQVGISVRFLDNVETCYLTFVRKVEGFEWKAPEPANYVDVKVFEKLRLLQYQPSETCSDEEFLRRVFVDVTGLLPKVEETVVFLDDSDKQKRSKLIDRLLERPDFARFWAFRWGDLLRISPTTVKEAGTHKYNAWIVKAWEENLPYDQFARQLLTAQGSTLELPPANFFRTTANTSEATEMAAQIFLGARVQCAKCHNHPFEKWTQDNYYGLGAFFERVQRKKGPRTDEMVIYNARRGEITQPRTGKKMPPWAPGTGEVAVGESSDRLVAFADWLTAPDNPYFARVEVNRIWWQLMGKGIVEPIDDFRESNPPTNPELLEALAKDFVLHKFDRKHILKTILSSRTYQASSRTNAFNQEDDKNFSHARQQVLTAEQLLDAVCQVTGQPEKYGNLPIGTRATQLPAPQPGNAFLVAFGQPSRQSSCACERQSQPSLTQALQLSNSQTVESRLKNGGGQFIRELAAKKKGDEEIIESLYLAALCRRPREVELQHAKTFIASHADRSVALEDVAWSVLNLREFVFRH
jgi:Protein of unknown function (DUF1553)/Protein of unknown function (DUF1549)